MPSPSVFKAYDIRGRTDTGDLDAELYRSIGQALVGALGISEIAVGRDCRETSPLFFDALAKGLTESGADVIDIGQVPTDAVYFYSGAQAVAGAMITASHNPPEYNGLKLCRPGAAPIGQESGLEEIREWVEEGRQPAEVAQGVVRSDEVVDEYVRHLFSIVDPGSIGPLRVAVDAGNGMAGVALGRVFGELRAEMTGLYLEPDGTFPNHPADPLVEENLVDLQELMSQRDFDLGVAFDGDADRAFFLDNEGKPLPGSTVTSLIARAVLEDAPGAKIVHNLITSKAVPELVREAGGIPIRTRVGHSFIKQVMADEGALFGGEHSGHYYFAENFRADSGMLAMLFILRALTADGRALSEVRRDVELYVTSGELNFRVDDPESVMANVRQHFSDAMSDDLDGLTVDVGDAWFNLRPSNTEPLLRLNVEAPDGERLDDLVSRVETAMGERS